MSTFEISHDTLRERDSQLEVLLNNRWIKAEDALLLLREHDAVLSEKLEHVLTSFKAFKAFRANNKAVVEAEFQPQLTVRDGAIYANSREVAEAFGKDHANVLRDIDNLLKSLETSKLSSLFSETSYQVEGQGRSYRSVDMTRDGLTLLVMGFTGEKALKFKLAYITAFNKLEEELRGRQQIDLNNPAHLRNLLGSYAERVETLEAKVVDQAKIVAVCERIVADEDDMTLSEGAKILGIPQSKFFDFLDNELRWTFKRSEKSNRLPYAYQVSQGWLKQKEVEDNQGRMRPQTVLTPMGLTTLAHILNTKGWTAQ